MYHWNASLRISRYTSRILCRSLGKHGVMLATVTTTGGVEYQTEGILWALKIQRL